jgi:hypothetical protein
LGSDLANICCCISGFYAPAMNPTTLSPCFYPCRDAVPKREVVGLWTGEKVEAAISLSLLKLYAPLFWRDTIPKTASGTLECTRVA